MIVAFWASVTNEDGYNMIVGSGLFHSAKRDVVMNVVLETSDSWIRMCSDIERESSG